MCGQGGELRFLLFSGVDPTSRTAFRSYMSWLHTPRNYNTWCGTPIPKRGSLTLYIFKISGQKQECIPVGCVPPACCPYLPACTARGCTCAGGCICLGGVPGLDGGRKLPGPGDVPAQVLAPVNRMTDRRQKYYLAQTSF